MLNKKSYQFRKRKSYLIDRSTSPHLSQFCTFDNDICNVKSKVNTRQR